MFRLIARILFCVAAFSAAATLAARDGRAQGVPGISGFMTQGTPSVVGTWNPSDKGAAIALSNNNRTAANGGSWNAVRSTTAESSGKWYFEVHVDALTSGAFIGLANASASLANYVGSDANSIGYGASGFVLKSGANYGTSIGAFTVGDTIGVALDFGTNVVWFSKNGVFAGGTPDGTGGRLLPSGPLFMATSLYNSTHTLNSSPTYPPPTGYKLWGTP